MEGKIEGHSYVKSYGDSEKSSYGAWKSVDVAVLAVLANFCKNGWIRNLGYQKWYAHGLKFSWCGTYDFLSEITMKYSKYQNLAVFG